MKRSKTTGYVEIIIADGLWKCDSCKHIREGEPYALFYIFTRGIRLLDKITCWRCCRDAESTLLIQQKWPVAFNRFQLLDCYVLDWAPSVQEMVDQGDEI